MRQASKTSSRPRPCRWPPGERPAIGSACRTASGAETCPGTSHRSFALLLRKGEAHQRLVTREGQIHDASDAELDPAPDENLVRPRQPRRQIAHVVDPHGHLATRLSHAWLRAPGRPARHRWRARASCRLITQNRGMWSLPWRIATGVASLRTSSDRRAMDVFSDSRVRTGSRHSQGGLVPAPGRAGGQGAARPRLVAGSPC